jgi:hypothetical protein
MSNISRFIVLEVTTWAFMVCFAVWLMFDTYLTGQVFRNMRNSADLGHVSYGWATQDLENGSGPGRIIRRTS